MWKLDSFTNSFTSTNLQWNLVTSYKTTTARRGVRITIKWNYLDKTMFYKIVPMFETSVIKHY